MAETVVDHILPEEDRRSDRTQRRLKNKNEGKQLKSLIRFKNFHLILLK